MAKYRDCISALAKAAGRELTDIEAAAIFERVHKAALDIKAGRPEPDDLHLYQSKDLSSLREDLKANKELIGGDDLIGRSAERAAKELIAEAEVVERQAQQQIVRLANRTSDIETLKAQGVKPLDAVNFLIARDYTDRVNVASLEQTVRGYEDYFLRKIIPSWEALGNDYSGFFQDRAKMVDLIKEIRGEDSGNPLAKKGAKAWRETAEEARQAFNANGGNIGRLDDWGMPQHHSQERVANVSKEAWVDQVLPFLDRSRYTNDLSGNGWTDTEMRDFLGKAWETIATNGNNKVEPGVMQGTGKRANRHAEHRQIHFKDAESQIAYWESFGERTFVEVLNNHIKTMARDIAFTDYFGPNPDLTYRTLRDSALKDQVIADPQNTTKLETKALRIDDIYDYAAGKRNPIYHPTFRKTADAIANLNIAGKLGSAVFSSLYGDKVMLEAVSHMNNLPVLQRWRTEMSMFNPANAKDRRFLQRQGLMLDSIRSGLQRFGDDLGQSGVTGKLANAVMRLTGMQAANDFRKGGFGASLMDGIGHEIQRGATFEKLADSDMRTLRNYGITSADWETWRLAKLDTMGGNYTMLTPEGISRISDADLSKAGLADNTVDAERVRREAIVKLLGAINTESEFAIVTPGYKERTFFQKGLYVLGEGEITRSILQFKSFPWAFFQRSMDAVANQDSPSSKMAMGAYIVVATTLAGAMTIQTKEMLGGKDPRNMTGEDDWYKFWGSAFIAGGALGFYGDFLYSINQNRYGSGPVEALAGPTVGPLLELSLVQPLTAAKKAIEGKETNLMSQTVQDIKGFIPGNNAWYTKAALDHLIWQQVMESMNPGYLSSMRRRTQREYGQDFWYEPGEITPSRAPNLGAAVQP